MKKSFKHLKFFLLIFLIIPCFLIFTGCSSGLSAYEIAVKNGFKGTEQEWLASLRGSDGTNGNDSNETDYYSLYLSAKQNGEFDGDYIEFLSKFINDSQASTEIINQNLLSVFEVYCYSQASSIVSSAQGSGVLYSYTDTGAFVLTNAHVACTSSSTYGAFNLGLYGFDDSTRIPASFVGASVTYDLAVLYVEDNTLLKQIGAKSITLASSNTKAGTDVVAIGNTQSKGIAISKGTVNVDSEEWSIDIFNSGNSINYRLIRHDAYITHGNSGGGLFDSTGKLVGITNGGVKNSDNLNFAIPASTVKFVADNIISNCYNQDNNQIKKCNLGLTVSYNGTSSKIKNGELVTTDIIKISAITEDGALDRASYLLGDKKPSVNDTLYSVIINQTEYILNRYYILEEVMLSVKPSDQITLKYIKSSESTIRSVSITFNNDDIMLIA